MHIFVLFCNHILGFNCKNILSMHEYYVMQSNFGLYNALLHLNTWRRKKYSIEFIFSWWLAALVLTEITATCCFLTPSFINLLVQSQKSTWTAWKGFPSRAETLMVDPTLPMSTSLHCPLMATCPHRVALPMSTCLPALIMNTFHPALIMSTFHLALTMNTSLPILTVNSLGLFQVMIGQLSWMKMLLKESCPLLLQQISKVTWQITKLFQCFVPSKRQLDKCKKAFSYIVQFNICEQYCNKHSQQRS